MAVSGVAPGGTRVLRQAEATCFCELGRTGSWRLAMGFGPPGDMCGLGLDLSPIGPAPGGQYGLARRCLCELGLAQMIGAWRHEEWRQADLCDFGVLPDGAWRHEECARRCSSSSPGGA